MPCTLCWRVGSQALPALPAHRGCQAPRDEWPCCSAAVHTMMLNAYGGYLPNNTIDTVSAGQAQFLYGNNGGLAFHNGNYPQ